MTKRKRRFQSPDFRARVAFEALKGIKPIHGTAVDQEIHPVQVSQWKKELQENMADLFEWKNACSKDADDEARKIEQL